MGEITGRVIGVRVGNKWFDVDDGELRTTPTTESARTLERPKPWCVGSLSFTIDSEGGSFDELVDWVDLIVTQESFDAFCDRVERALRGEE